MIKTVYTDLFEDEIAEILDSLTYYDKITVDGKTYRINGEFICGQIYLSGLKDFVHIDEHHNRNRYNRNYMIDKLLHDTFIVERKC